MKIKLLPTLAAILLFFALTVTGCESLDSVMENFDVLASAASDGDSTSASPEYDVSLICARGSIPDPDTDETFSVLRGGYTDGKYIYAALHNGSNTDPRCAIIKIDPDDGSAAVVATGIVAGSVSDLCYNPDENTVIAVHGAPELQKISVFDAETFDLIETESVMLQIDAITYDPEEKVYYAGIAFGCNFAKLDADFRVIGTRVGTSHSHIRSGMDFIDGNIHFVTQEENSLRLYTSDGEYVDSATAVFENGLIIGNPENVMHVGDVIYLGCSDPSDGTIRIYSLTPVSSGEGGTENAET